MTKIEPIEIHWPEYHSSAMGCGLEDRGIHNRYDAMLHGWERAVERCMEAVPDEPIVLASEVVKVLAAKDAEIARLQETNRRLNRRVQISEAVRQSAEDYLGAWINVFKTAGISSERRRHERFYIVAILRDIKRRVARLSERADTALRPARYEARGNVVHKLPVKVRNETDTNTTFEVGFPACTASEYVEATAIAALLDRGERVLEAAGGIADDCMTSEHHHPGYVLIPTAKFEAIRAASGMMDNETPTPPGNQIRTAECDGKDAVPVTGLLPIGTASTPAVMTDEVASLYSETTPDDGIIRLARWPEGYVLWFHGKIVWRSWISDRQARAEMLRKIESVLNIPSAGHASAGELADTILDALGFTEESTNG